MQTYKIIINEEQRQIMVRAIMAFVAANRHRTEDILEEPFLLLDMFRELPDLEPKDPGVMHGFCY